MSKQIQLKTVKTVEIEPESAVPPPVSPDHVARQSAIIVGNLRKGTGAMPEVARPSELGELTSSTHLRRKRGSGETTRRGASSSYQDPYVQLYPSSW